MTVKRFETLDAMRGVAAFSVVIYHLGSNKILPGVAPRGYLAVDFFFILSGFVVAFAYEGPLQTRLSWGRFVLKRCIRLYPLALLGLGMGAVVLLLKWLTHPDKVDGLPHILSSIGLNGFLLPILSRSRLTQSELFPVNSPLWTLSLELAANLIWAWIGIGRRTSTLIAFTAVSWLALIAAGAEFHSGNTGFDLTTLGGGVARVCFGFTLGVVLYRLLPRIRIPSIRFGPVLLYAGLLLVLCWPIESDPAGVPWGDLVIVTFFMPAIVMLGLGQVTSGRAAMWMGGLSYPIYVLHMPIQLLTSGLRQTVPRNVDPVLLAAVTVVVILAYAAIAWRVYDEPARLWLTRRLSGARLPPQRAPFPALGEQSSD